MLIEFRVENHRSIQAEQVLSMEADGRLGEKSDPRPRKIPQHNKKILPVAAIYGANASGKSNMLSGLGFMSEAVYTSTRFWDPEEGVPQEPFGWGEYNTKPSTYEVSFIEDGVKYVFGFVIDRERFLEEWLFAWPKGSQQKWYIRTGDSYHFSDYLRGENRSIEKLTRPNALFLSTAMQHGHKQLRPVFTWLARKIRTNNFRDWRFMSRRIERYLAGVLRDTPDHSRQGKLFAKKEEDRGDLRRSIRDLILSADIGISDFKVITEDENVIESGRKPGSRNARVFFKHSEASDDGWLSIEQESQGTLTLLQMVPALFHVLETGGVLVIDEIESSLHPALSLEIIYLFNDPKTNPMNSQIVFTTHDTNLLGNLLMRPPLRRDQVWLTEKNNEGMTLLYPLTDFKPRKAENLERGYLQGRYGGVPFLSSLIKLGGSDGQ